MTEPKGKTLAELDVHPGDVVMNPNGYHYTVKMNDDGEPCDKKDMCRLVSDEPIWRLIYRARAKLTRAQLIAQRDALDAQIAAMPETVRVYFCKNDGHIGTVAFVDITHYRDFPMIDGVPEGFVEVSK